MKTRTFNGGFFEIGRQIGSIYRKNGMKLNNSRIDEKLFANQLKIYKKYYPGLLEEFNGIAEAAKLDERQLSYRLMTMELLYFTRHLNLGKACTIFGVKNKNGTFVGRNYDWSPETEKAFELYKVTNPRRNTFIALSDMYVLTKADPRYLFYEPDDAINDKGLFIGLTFAYDKNWSYGISSMHMIRLIAETCSTVDDAIKTFKRVPVCCPKNFFIADKNGKMAVIEHTSKKFAVVYPENDVLIQTNHYIDRNLSEEDAVLKYKPEHNTFLRYFETLQKVNSSKDRFKIGRIMQILGAKNSYTCQDHPGMRTIWSLALEMEKKEYKLYYNILGKRKERNLVV